MNSIQYWNWLERFAFLMQQNYTSGSEFKIGCLKIGWNTEQQLSTCQHRKGKKILYISRVRGCFSAKHTNRFFMRKHRSASLIERSPVTLLSAAKCHKKRQFIDLKNCRPIQTCRGYGSTLVDDGLQCCALTRANMCQLLRRFGLRLWLITRLCSVYLFFFLLQTH